MITVRICGMVNWEVNGTVKIADVSRYEITYPDSKEVTVIAWAKYSKMSDSLQELAEWAYLEEGENYKKGKLELPCGEKARVISNKNNRRI